MSRNSADTELISLAEGKALWTVSDIFRAGEYTHTLTAADCEELHAAVVSVVSKRLGPADLRENRFPLGDFGARLHELGKCLQTGRGFCVIKGIPIDRYSRYESELLVAGIGSQIGRLMAQNPKGEIVNHVCNTEYFGSERPNSRGFENGNALPFHSDPCDIVGLLCLSQGLSGGSSALVSTYAAHNLLARTHPEVLRVLYRPFYIDRHGEGPANALPYYATPVFMRYNGRLFSRFNPGYVLSAQRYVETPRLTTAELNAIEVFASLCEHDSLRLDMQLGPGDLQLVNNNVLVHSRSAFVDDPVFDNRRRHLLRVWLSTHSAHEIPAPMRDRYHDMQLWQTH